MLGTTVTLYNTLDELGIDYTEVTHPAVTTMEAAQFVRTLIDGTPIKNLFLTNRKGNYYLVLMSEDRRADLKALAQIIGTGRLSFANADDLRRVLNLEPGSVTPLALINDADQQVEVLVDTALAVTGSSKPRNSSELPGMRITTGLASTHLDAEMDS